MTQTSTTRAGNISGNIVNAANDLVATHLNYKTNGIPAQGGKPFVTPSEYITALGTVNLAVLDAIAAANPQS